MLDLLPELRFLIYECCFQLPGPHFIVNRFGLCYRTDAVAYERYPVRKHAAAILRYCRKIYKEAYEIVPNQCSPYVGIGDNFEPPPNGAIYLGDVEYCNELEDVGEVWISIDLHTNNNRDF